MLGSRTCLVYGFGIRCGNTFLSSQPLSAPALRQSPKAFKAEDQHYKDYEGTAGSLCQVAWSLSIRCQGLSTFGGVFMLSTRAPLLQHHREVVSAADISLRHQCPGTLVDRTPYLLQPLMVGLVARATYVCPPVPSSSPKSQASGGTSGLNLPIPSRPCVRICLSCLCLTSLLYLRLVTRGTSGCVCPQSMSCELSRYPFHVVIHAAASIMWQAEREPGSLLKKLQH